MPLTRRAIVTVAVAGAVVSTPSFAGAQPAESPVRIGLILPLTGPFASSGRQMLAGAKLYTRQNGDMVAGRKIELIVRNDTGNADSGKRISQELVINDKVSVLAGFGLTPIALATAPIANEAKIPMVLMMAAGAIITEKSPYIVRASFSLPQSVAPIANWAVENGIKSVVTLVSDYAPAHDVELYFKTALRGGWWEGDRIIAGATGQSRFRTFPAACRRRQT